MNTRRNFLGSMSQGAAGIALSQLMAGNTVAAAAKAKRIIYLFQ